MKIPGGRKKLRVAWVGGVHDPLDEGYYHKVVTLADTLTHRRGGVSVVDVQHDAWCPKLHGGPCRCDPDVIDRGLITEPANG